MKKAAFFDRDGTINVNTGHLYEPEKMEFIPGRPELIKKHNDEGYIVIVITNQAGIAKGMYTVEDMNRLHEYMNQKLMERWGAHIDTFYFCPHYPYLSGPCDCRKPAPGMIEKAIRDFEIDVTQSVLYGDKPHDIEAGEKCGIRSVLVETKESL
jgi:D,D-heptose 1,7-bisphosphate phosphatase